jgi:hypothetical protein
MPNLHTRSLSLPLQSLHNLQSGIKTHSFSELQAFNKRRTVELLKVFILPYRLCCLCGCAVLHTKAQSEYRLLVGANGEYRGQTVVSTGVLVLMRSACKDMMLGGASVMA